ncbi:MAG: hypothetical protein HGB04_04750 [Chlorobiaceae bacterium]|nr:hypothetical protein [Chlorobiaceae bacterium]
MKILILLLVLIFVPVASYCDQGSGPALQTALDAAKKGDRKAIIAWLKAGGEPDQADTAGWTPLLKAAACGQAGVVDLLLANPVRVADPGKPFTPTGALPIHMAAHSGSVSTVSRILDARPQDLNAVFLLNGHTPLLEASFYGHAGLASFLLKKGANPAATTLRGLTAADFARQFDNRSLLEAVSSNPVNEQQKQAYYAALLKKVQEPVPHGQEALQKRSDDLVSLIESSLRSVSLNPEQADRFCHDVEGLLDGADINRCGGPLGQPPLVVVVTGTDTQPHPEAAALLRMRLARMLLERGASPLVHERHPMGVNAIIRASVFGRIDILRLMASRISPAELAAALNELPPVNGLTALHDAVLRAGTANASHLSDYLEQIRWEVASGARTDIEDFSGLTQRDYALRIVDPERRRAVIEVLDSLRSIPQWNHVAIGVGNIEDAVRWYGEVFGFMQVGSILVHRPDDPMRWPLAQTLFGSGIVRVRSVTLRVPDALMLQKLELFEVSPAPQAPVQPRSGVIHGCLVVGDVDLYAGRAEAHGGRILYCTTVRGIRIVFCSDPSGNIFELASEPW